MIDSVTIKNTKNPADKRKFFTWLLLSEASSCAKENLREMKRYAVHPAKKNTRLLASQARVDELILTHLQKTMLLHGIALPYGNSKSIPFTRSYYAGGTNDNRAWKAYKLGPGSSSGINEFNEANFKIALNLEYRYPIIGPSSGINTCP